LSFINNLRNYDDDLVLMLIDEHPSAVLILMNADSVNGRDRPFRVVRHNQGEHPINWERNQAVVAFGVPRVVPWMRVNLREHPEPEVS
jgi:hypothetical protein